MDYEDAQKQNVRLTRGSANDKTAPHECGAVPCVMGDEGIEPPTSGM